MEKKITQIIFKIFPFAGIKAELINDF